MMRDSIGVKKDRGIVEDSESTLVYHLPRNFNDDPKFLSWADMDRALLRPENVAERIAAFTSGVARLSTEEAYRRMLEFEVPAAPILDHAAVLVDPQIAHNGTVVEAMHPIYGRYRRTRPAARFSRTAPDPTR